MWLAAVHGAGLLSHLLGGAEGPLYFAVHICLTVLHEDGTFGVTLGHFLLPLQRREAAVSGALHDVESPRHAQLGGRGRCSEW